MYSFKCIYEEKVLSGCLTIPFKLLRLLHKERKPFQRLPYSCLHISLIPLQGLAYSPVDFEIPEKSSTLTNLCSNLNQQEFATIWKPLVNNCILLNQYYFFILFTFVIHFLLMISLLLVSCILSTIYGIHSHSY